MPSARNPPTSTKWSQDSENRESCIIAATALLVDEPVVTRNGAHFERIDGLDAEIY